MGLTPDDPRPPYVQIADDLRRAICDGEFSPGDQLPSNRMLMERYGVAPQTVQSAFRLLKDDGLTYSVHGRGTFVRTDISSESINGALTDGGIDGKAVAAELGSMRNGLAELGERVERLEAEVKDLRGG